MNITGQIEQLLGDWVTAICQRALLTDPDFEQHLVQLEGRCIELRCSMPTTTWHLVFVGGKLAFHPGAADGPNVIVKGRAVDLLDWLINQRAEGIEIEGDDTTLLETLATLRTFNPELENTLEHVFGKALSGRVLGGAEAGLRGVKSVLQGLGSGLDHEVAHRFVRKDNLHELLTRIDDLRLRVDRLAANIKSKETGR